MEVPAESAAEGFPNSGAAASPPSALNDSCQPAHTCTHHCSQGAKVRQLISLTDSGECSAATYGTTARNELRVIDSGQHASLNATRALQQFCTDDTHSVHRVSASLHACTSVARAMQQALNIHRFHICRWQNILSIVAVHVAPTRAGVHTALCRCNIAALMQCSVGYKFMGVAFSQWLS